MIRPAVRLTRGCAVPSCEERIPTSRLMCSPHWEQVPAELRRRVTAAWRIWKLNFLDRVSADRHQSAAEAAVQAVLNG